MKDRDKLNIDEILYKNIAKIVGGALVIGIFSIYVVEWLMTVKADKFVSTDFLAHLSNFYAPLGIVFSGITILLLYVNFKHQQKELKKINKANKRLVNSSFKANDIQVILFEKQMVDRDLTKLIEQNGKSIFEAFCSQIFDISHTIIKEDEEYIRNEHLRLLIKKGNEYSKNILNFIIQFNSKLTILEKSSNDKQTLELFLDSIGTEIMEMLFALYNKELKQIFNNYNIVNLDIYEYAHYQKLHYIINETPYLNKLIDNHFNSIGVNDLSTYKDQK